MDCKNEIDDFVFNRCLIQAPDSFLTNLANVVQQYANPRELAIFTATLVLLIPFFSMVLQSSSHKITRRLQYLQFYALNFLHRVGYSLVLDVGLYAAFRQRRPCICKSGDAWVPVGSRYGMPSGDAMAGGILGAFLADGFPVSSILGVLLGLLVMAWTCMERVVLGYHTIGQVMVGCVMGMFLHFYSTRLPQYMIFIDVAAQWVAGSLLLYFDSSLEYTKEDFNNLTAWFVWGVGFQVFVVMMLGKHFRDHPEQLRKSLVKLNTTKFDVELDPESQSLNEHPDEPLKVTSKLSPTNIVYMFVSFGVLLLINIFSNCIEQYNWFNK